MKWTNIEIVDYCDQTHTGAAARTFVEANCVVGLVQTYLDDRLAVKSNGTMSVAAFEVNRILIDALSEKVKRLSIVGLTDFSRKAMTPRRSQTNLINVVPKYELSFELGDIDALFEAINVNPKPWKELGVQQRLQVLGYLYTPLQHPGNNAALDFKHAKSCWEYFKRVHGAPADDAAIDLLKREVSGNLITTKLPQKADVLPKSSLPANGTFGAIRFPGGYGATRSPVTNLNAGDHLYNDSVDSNVNAGVNAKYNFGAGDRRSDIENIFAKENPLLGMFPLIAKVTARWPNGSITFPKNVPVYFKLLMPVDVTDPLAGDAKFAPESLPDKVMNYAIVGLYWRFPVYPKEVSKNLGLNEEEWSAVYKLTHEAVDVTLASSPQPKDDQVNNAASAKADSWIDQWAPIAPVPQTAVQGWWEPATPAPYTRLLVPEEYVTKQLNFLFTKIDPTVVSPFQRPLNLMRMSPPEWTALYRLIATAKSSHPTDDTAGKQLATTWIHVWASAPAINFPQIQVWWKDPAKTPYPKLRSNMIAKAKDAVKYLLEQRVEAGAVTSEILNAGQKKYIDELLRNSVAEADKVDAANPQRRNAPNNKYGGKMGLDIDSIFEESGKTYPGFHTKRPDQVLDRGTLNKATLPSDRAKHKYAMRCDTNDLGYAGVIFKPSRCGGDSYKLCAYIDPDWLEDHARGVNHTSICEAGTLVVWRNIRFNRYLQLKNPRTSFGANLAETIRRGANQPGTLNYDQMYLNTDVSDLLLLPGTASEGVSYTAHDINNFMYDENMATKVRYRPLAVTPKSFKTQLSWGYCELIADTDAIEVLTPDKLRAGIEAGKRGFNKYFSRLKPVSWDHLAFEDPASPFMLNFRSCRHYNELIRNAGLGAAFPDLVKADDDALGKAIHWFFDAMMEYYSEAVAPGLTVVQFPRWSTWDFRVIGINFYEEGVIEGFVPPVTSGYGPPVRGSYVSNTFGSYNNLHCYPATSNAIHELGHNLCFAHQVPAGADIAEAHQNTPFYKNKSSVAFVQPTPDECVCVMSYSGCYGDLCGSCIMSLRGWAQSHENTTDS